VEAPLAFLGVKPQKTSRHPAQHFAEISANDELSFSLSEARRVFENSSGVEPGELMAGLVALHSFSSD